MYMRTMHSIVAAYVGLGDVIKKINTIKKNLIIKKKAGRLIQKFEEPCLKKV